MLLIYSCSILRVRIALALGYVGPAVFARGNPDAVASRL